MARPRADAPSWSEKAADIMVREAKNLRQAADQIDIVLTPEEASKLERQEAFKEILWAARQKYYKSLGSDPKLTKDVVVGQLLHIAKGLESQGDLDKAGTILFQIARMRDWIGTSSNEDVFAGLSQKDLDEIDRKLRSASVKTSRDGDGRASEAGGPAQGAGDVTGFNSEASGN